jgi:hypothetical protein
MERAIEKKWASIDTNGDFIFIETQSGYRSCVSDPLGESFYLSPNIDDQTLGKAVLKALAKSRIIAPEDFGTFFDRDRIQEYYESWVEKTKELYGYKTKKAMFRNMDYCSVVAENNTIKFEPWHHEKLESWGATANGKADYVIIPDSSPEEAVGAALRLALSRCTTKGF